MAYFVVKIMYNFLEYKVGKLYNSIMIFLLLIISIDLWKDIKF